MRQLIIRALLLATSMAAGVVLTIGPASALAPRPAELSDKSCGLAWFPQPDRSPAAAGPVIYVEVVVDCDEPPASHELTVLLQRRDSDGNWVTQATQVTKEIPAPRVRLRVSAECGAGVWRGLAHATGSLQSNQFNFTDISQIATVGAKDCK